MDEFLATAESLKTVGNMTPFFLPVIYYNSPETMCNGYMVTDSNGPSQITKLLLVITRIFQK